ncbi:heat-shock protein Hsp20 [Streptomyces platensis subsp. clarensis]|uniref:Heat-shock protein Hsp20 n=1 Tax=Streptomyces showdoensis TaxID=68268 RepID=A0A2P2GVB5_STREW|nr:Hsp20/alpha crystallin family protein [Streptomyces showdoensis]KKZ75426.1 heat-shock protein Hsp20 [Streptomyces showdoensis]MCW7991220.1 heat-shock protein Hsp20 [Streptomyces platensis subsp. clarensis]
MTGDKGERRRRRFPDFNDWFDREFPGLPGWRPATAAHSIPVETTSADGAYVLRAELPGMDPDDIAVTVDDDLITVSAEHAEGEQDKEHSEFRYGAFRRTVRLPGAIPVGEVDASYADGILTIRVPMPEAESGTVRSIPVRRAGSGGGRS